jgi:hypothetical protein
LEINSETAGIILGNLNLAMRDIISGRTATDRVAIVVGAN